MNSKNIKSQKRSFLSSLFTINCSLFTAIAALLLLPACSSTTVTKTTYAEDGVTVESVENTETNESPIVIAMSNLENKHVVAHLGGWYAGIGVDPNSSTYGIKAGTLDNTYASLVATKDGLKTDAAQVVQYFPAVVDASKYSLSITADGVNSTSTTTSTTTSTDEAESSTEVSETATESE